MWLWRVCIYKFTIVSIERWDAVKDHAAASIIFDSQWFPWNPNDLSVYSPRYFMSQYARGCIANLWRSFNSPRVFSSIYIRVMFAVYWQVIKLRYISFKYKCIHKHGWILANDADNPLCIHHHYLAIYNRRILLRFFGIVNHWVMAISLLRVCDHCCGDQLFWLLVIDDSITMYYAY